MPLYGVRISDFNKATIKPESEPVLTKAATSLLSGPGNFEVRGHTDTVGGESNLKPPEARSQRAHLAHGQGHRRRPVTRYGFRQNRSRLRTMAQQRGARRTAWNFNPMRRKVNRGLQPAFDACLRSGGGGYCHYDIVVAPPSTLRVEPGGL